MVLCIFARLNKNVFVFWPMRKSKLNVSHKKLLKPGREENEIALWGLIFLKSMRIAGDRSNIFLFQCTLVPILDDRITAV